MPARGRAGGSGGTRHCAGDPDTQRPCRDSDQPGGPRQTGRGAFAVILRGTLRLRDRTVAFETGDLSSGGFIINTTEALASYLGDRADAELDGIGAMTVRLASLRSGGAGAEIISITPEIQHRLHSLMDRLHAHYRVFIDIAVAFAAEVSTPVQHGGEHGHD